MKKQSYAVGRKPDFILKALDKGTNEKGKVGAAWNNPDGSITVDIDAFVVIPAGPSLLLTLFPNEE